MDIFLQTLRAIFALGIVLGLILGLTYVLRRYAPGVMARLQAERGTRRMKVVETLVLDPARRLVLIKIDDEERLILLGEGRELIEPRPEHLKMAHLKKPAATSHKVPSSSVSDANDDLF